MAKRVVELKASHTRVKPRILRQPVSVGQSLGVQRIPWLEFDRMPMAQPCH